MADHSVEIAALETVLNTGATAVSVDGLNARYDFDAIRKRLNELKADDDATQALARVRPPNSTIKLNYY